MRFEDGDMESETHALGVFKCFAWGVCKKKNQMNEVESINSYKPIQKTNKVFFFDKKH